MIDTYKKLSPYLGEITIMLNNNLISIQNHGKIISYTYDELLAHHGGHLPGGVALSFRMMQWLFDSVLKTTPEYGKFGFYTGLGKKRSAGIELTEDEQTHLQQLRIDLSKAILAADASDLFVLIRIENI